jgi:hypothetical protein
MPSETDQAAATTRRPRPRAPVLPPARGPLSAAVAHTIRTGASLRAFPPIGSIDVLIDDDAQLALTCCYELHYRGFDGVVAEMEWEPGLLRFRRELEAAFLRRVEDEIGPVRPTAHTAVLRELRALAEDGSGPSLSSFMEQRGTLAQMREFCTHRSAYQLKEADPHTWMIPRLVGRAKAAAVTIQYDEYGGGTRSAMHSELFATTMTALGLDPACGTYLDALPGTTLATGNLVSLFGLHRRWSAACVGHLALFEMTSVTPMARYAAALRRLGVGSDAARFYDVHVEADAWHEKIAQHELVDGHLESEPDSGGTIVFGARALAEVERRMAEALLHAWSLNQSSLRPTGDATLLSA